MGKLEFKKTMLPRLRSKRIAFYLDEVYSLAELNPAPASATYTREVLCLPPEMADRPVVFEAYLQAFGMCAQFIPVEAAWLDDFEVITDPACPAL